MFKEFCYYLFEIHSGNESENIKFLKAIIGITFFQILNLLSILGIVTYLLKFQIPKNLIVFLCITICLIIFVINYIFIYKDRSNIVKSIKGFSLKREKIGKGFFVIYMLVTLFAMYYVMQNFSSTNY